MNMTIKQAARVLRHLVKTEQAFCFLEDGCVVSRADCLLIIAAHRVKWDTRYDFWPLELPDNIPVCAWGTDPELTKLFHA